MGLFNCYVREYSFVKQQQVGVFKILLLLLLFFFFFVNLLVGCHFVCGMWTMGPRFTYFNFNSWQTAIKMYKLVGEERFLLWAVCSIQLQVFPSSTPHFALHVFKLYLVFLQGLIVAQTMKWWSPQIPTQENEKHESIMSFINKFSVGAHNSHNQ